MVDGVYRFDDPMNTKGLRNIENTPRRTFNCAGYALGTYSWYCPHDEAKDGLYAWYGEYVAKRKMGELTRKAVEQMLADFDDLRVISYVHHLRKDEYAIAFRISSNGDFHYIKRGRNGKWQHKRGGNPVIETMTSFQVFHTNWCYGQYDGEIVLFAKKY